MITNGKALDVLIARNQRFVNALKRLKITHKKRLTNIQKPTQRKESTFKNK
ncbi:hypothetical protein [Suttonella ornithocola]|uniref:hypothetical protein n=1 Tax=Suttonella ornithocola TaxID=279832 RepID=UPI001B80A56C|nr:hypothetical protein [Suttonella ornithocola]